MAAAVLLDPRGRSLLIRQLGGDGALFSHMWQFPALEAVGTDSRLVIAAYLEEKFRLAINGNLLALATARHTVTFRNIRLEPYLVRVARLPRIADASIVALAEVPSMSISECHTQDRRCSLILCRAMTAEVLACIAHKDLGPGKRDHFARDSGTILIARASARATKSSFLPLPDTLHTIPSCLRDVKLVVRAMDPASQIPAQSLPAHLSAVRRHFEISLYFLLLTGVLTLVCTGKLDLVTILVLPACMLFQGLSMVAWQGAGNFESHGHLADCCVLCLLPF